MANTIELDLREVERLLAMGLTEEQMATSMGVSVSTITRRKKDDAQFAECIKRSKQLGITQVTNALFDSAVNPDKPNTSAAIFWLKNRAHWRDRQEIEATIGGNVSVEHDIESALDALKAAGIDPNSI